MNPRKTPNRDIGDIFFPWKTRINRSTISGCEDISKAAKLVSTYLSAHTTTPFPKLKNKNPAIAVFTACFFVIAIDLPDIFAMIKIRLPDTKKRIAANMNGSSSVTAILLSK